MKTLIPQDPKELSNIYFGLSPAYNFESLRLLVTVDTIFIHEFFLFLSQDCLDSEEKKSGYLYAFMTNRITISQIWRDLLLTGNQLPVSFLINLIQEFPHNTRISELQNFAIAIIYLIAYMFGQSENYYKSIGDKPSIHVDSHDYEIFHGRNKQLTG